MVSRWRQALTLVGVFILGVISLPLVWFALAGPRRFVGGFPAGRGFVRPGMAPYMGGFGFGIGSLLFWLLLIALFVYLFSRLSGSGRGYYVATESPLAILQRRYAAGEIDKDAYEQMRGDLQAPAGNAGPPANSPPPGQG